MLEATKPGNGRALYNGSGSDAPWQPLILEDVDPKHLDAFNAFYKRRQPIQASVSGRSATFAPAWRKEPPAIADPWLVLLDLGGEAVELIAPQALIERLFERFAGHISPDLLKADEWALLLEHAVSHALDRLDAMLGVRSSVSSMQNGASLLGKGKPAFLIEVEIEGLPKSLVALKASPQLLTRFAQALDKLPGAQPSMAIDLPLPLNLRLASVDLSFGELKSLRSGDIVLADHHCREPDTYIAVIAEDLAAPVKMLPGGFQLLDMPKPARAIGLDWAIADRSSPRGFGLETSINNLPVRVFLELAQFELSLKKLQELTRGAVIGSPHANAGQLTLSAEGVKFGKGEMTAIGGNAGIRVLQA